LIDRSCFSGIGRRGWLMLGRDSRVSDLRRFGRVGWFGWSSVCGLGVGIGRGWRNWSNILHRHRIGLARWCRRRWRGCFVRCGLLFINGWFRIGDRCGAFGLVLVGLFGGAGGAGRGRHRGRRRRCHGLLGNARRCRLPAFAVRYIIAERKSATAGDGGGNRQQDQGQPFVLHQSNPPDLRRRKMRLKS